MATRGRRTDFRSTAGDRALPKRRWIDLHLKPRYVHWKVCLADLLRLVGPSGAKRMTVGQHTQAKRRKELFLCFETLQALGHRLTDVRQLKGRHVEHLVKWWLEQEHAASTIQGRLSNLRWLASWTGKDGLVLAAESYSDDPARVTRAIVARTDRSWTPRGVDPATLTAAVASTDPRVGAQLAMTHAFGLRVREALQFRPHLDDLGDVLHIRAGTKGGRDRIVRVTTPRQRDVVDHAKTFAASPHASLIASNATLAQGRRRFYYVLQQHGVTKAALGVTAHGLRHELLNDMYESLTGLASPVRGGTHRADADTETAARIRITETAGHSRLAIGGAYYGPLKGMPRMASNAPAPDPANDADAATT